MKYKTIAIMTFATITGILIAGQGIAAWKSQTPFFDHIDSDGDGFLSESEVLETRMNLFSRVDRNGDGVLSEEDRSALAERVDKFRKLVQLQREALESADIDEDGQLTAEEFESSEFVLFDMVDLNRDGLISQQEIKLFLAVNM